MSEQISDGFLPKRLTLHKFVTWNRKNPETIYFDGQLISISGVNGAGKSLIIDAITFALFGTTSRTGKKIKEVLHRNGFVEFEFEKSGHIWIVKRGRGTSESSSYLKLSCDGEELHNKNTENQEKLLSIMGMNYNTFKYTTLIPQFGENLTTLTPVPRANILKDIFKLNVLDDALTYIKEEEKDVNKKQEIKVKEVETHKSYLIDVEKYKELKEMIISSNKQKEVELDNILKTIEALNVEIESISKLKDIYISSTAKLESINDNIKNNERRLASLKKPEKDAQAEKKAKELEKFEKLLDKHTSLSNELSKLNEHKKLLLKQLSNLQLETERTLSKYKDLRILSPEEADIKAKEILENYKNNDIDYKIVIKELQPVIFTEYILDIKNSAKEKEQEISNNINTVITEIKKIESNTILKYSNYDLKKEIQLCRDAEQKNNSYSLLLENYNSKYKEYSDNIVILKDSLDKIKENIEKTKDSYVIFNTLDTKKNKLFDQKNVVYSEIKLNTSRINDIDKAILENQKIIEKINQINKELEELASDYGALNDLKSIFGNFQTHTLNYYLETLSHEATELIVKMTAHRSGEDGAGNPRRYSNISFTSKKNGIELLIDKREASSFSGGEIAIIGMAIRVAISIMLARMQDMNSHSKALIIDEGQIGAMDNDMATMMIKMLFEAREIFDKIIMITHKDNLLNNFDQFIEIDPTGGSHVVNN